MSSTTISWTETTPADADNLSAGAAAIRSLQTSLRNGLSAEHVWPSSSGPAGAHARGSARMFVGPTSQVSSADTDGRLMLDSTKSRAWYVGSEATFPIGGRSYPEVSLTVNPVPALNHWVLSGFTLSAKTAQVTPSGGPGAGIFCVTLDSEGLGNGSQPSNNAYCTIAANGLGGNIPIINIWNADGTPYSGATVIIHCLGLSLASY